MRHRKLLPDQLALAASLGLLRRKRLHRLQPLGENANEKKACQPDYDRAQPSLVKYTYFDLILLREMGIGLD
jgi:hypothetical protein